MGLSKQTKETVISKFRAGKTDTGSAAVQVALLTERINGLTEHFKQHKKDHHSRYGLIKLVGKRRRLLNYLKKSNSDKYLALIKQLDLRK